MALLFLESFDHLTNLAAVVTKWTQVYSNPATAPSISASAGRRSTQGLRNNITNSTGQPLAVTLSDASGATCIVGFAFNQSTGAFASLVSNTEANPNLTLGAGNSNGLVYIRDTGTNQVMLRINNDGTLSVLRGTASATVLGTTTNALTAGVFAYIELQVLISDTVGTVNLYVNGASWLSLSSQDTKATSNATWNEVAFGHNITNAAVNIIWDFDDIYIADANTLNSDGSTSTWTAAKQRDIRVDVVYPNSDGTHSEFTRSTGSDQYATVDEALANDDTDYNSSSTVNQLDTLNFPNAPVAGATIYGLQVNQYLKKSDAGAAQTAAVTRIGSTDYIGTVRSFSTSYSVVRQTWDSKPSDNIAWTDTAFNAAEFGYKKTT